MPQSFLFVSLLSKGRRRLSEGSGKRRVENKSERGEGAEVQMGRGGSSACSKRFFLDLRSASFLFCSVLPSEYDRSQNGTLDPTRRATEASNKEEF